MDKILLLKILLINMLIFTTLSSWGQSCNVGNVVYCYGNNENTILTYCPDNPVTQTIVVKVNAYSFQSGSDALTVYDGIGIGGTQLAQFTGTGNSGFSYIGTSQANGGNGCITLRITSNGSRSCATLQQTPTNWDVFCQTECTPPTAALSANMTEMCSTEADNQIIGAVVNFNALNSTHGNGILFTSYEWNFGDGTTQTTTIPTVTHTYSTAGGYLPYVIVTDNLGCQSTNLADQFIKVSGPPTFTLSSDAPVGGVCQGTSFNLMGSQVNYTWQEAVQQPNAPPTNLPDGTGATFTSPVLFTQFGDTDVIQDGTNLTVTLNMEHSYMGDLKMQLVCPNGTRVNLLNFPNVMANTNTGGATTSAGAPGPGQNYTFSMSAATLFNTNTNSADLNLPTGNYRPDGNFANLNGCPLNGEWNIEITDNFDQDDGTLFSWTIQFSTLDENKRTLKSFTNTYPTAVWTGNGVVGNTATPTSSGVQTYTYTVTDDYGCEYSETLDVTVLPSSNLACNAPPTIISNSIVNFPENSTAVVLNVESTDDNDSEGSGLTYTFTGNGGDEIFFILDSNDGEIRFLFAPNYENPNDANMDNNYTVEIEVCDSDGGCIRQLISVLVNDVDEDGDSYINSADPDDSDPCVPDPSVNLCQQNCNASAPMISKN